MSHSFANQHFFSFLFSFFPSFVDPSWTRAFRPEPAEKDNTTWVRDYAVENAWAMDEPHSRSYIFYWSGKTSTDRIWCGFCRQESSSLKYVWGFQTSDRLIILRFSLDIPVNIVLWSLLMPPPTTMTNNPKNGFKKLKQILRVIPNADKIFLLEDFKTWVGQSNYTGPKVLGKFGTMKAYTNDNVVLFICTEHQLVITNSYFKYKQIHKSSWMHLRSRHWHFID